MQAMQAWWILAAVVAAAAAATWWWRSRSPPRVPARYVRHMNDPHQTTYRVVGPGPMPGFIAAVDAVDGGRVTYFSEEQVDDIVGFSVKAARAEKLARIAATAKRDEGEVAGPPPGARV